MPPISSRPSGLWTKWAILASNLALGGADLGSARMGMSLGLHVVV
jgi:hypothetical protein